MSVIARAVTRLGGVGNLHRLPAVTQTTNLRNISWMAFEHPDPALYQSPPSLQPKRPAASSEAMPSGDGTTPSAQPMAMAGRAVSPQSAVASSRASASGKVIPASVPASAMRTGPVPLSQIQKRTIAGSDCADEPVTPQHQHRQQSAPSRDHEVPAFPTLQVRIPSHPATWPVQQPYQSRRDED